MLRRLMIRPLAPLPDCLLKVYSRLPPLGPARPDCLLIEYPSLPSTPASPATCKLSRSPPPWPGASSLFAHSVPSLHSPPTVASPGTWKLSRSSTSCRSRGRVRDRVVHAWTKGHLGDPHICHIPCHAPRHIPRHIPHLKTFVSRVQ
jgi:hypothetical protein